MRKNHFLFNESITQHSCFNLWANWWLSFGIYSGYINEWWFDNCGLHSLCYISVLTDACEKIDELKKKQTNISMKIEHRNLHKNLMEHILVRHCCWIIFQLINSNKYRTINSMCVCVLFSLSRNYRNVSHHIYNSLLLLN